MVAGLKCSTSSTPFDDEGLSFVSWHVVIGHRRVGRSLNGVQLGHADTCQYLVSVALLYPFVDPLRYGVGEEGSL